jgi:uncharacterized protein (TIGR03086 family)
MSEVTDRYERVAATFTERATEVPIDRWEQPSPCEGWTARDVVSHMVHASRLFLARAGVELDEGPSADDDPLGAWTHARDGVLAALSDPAIANREYETPMGAMDLETTVGRFGIGDVLVHTWDLARAAGLDDTLDPDEVGRLLAVMEPNDEIMRQGTAFGPKVDVPDDASDQDKLIAFTGRQP